MNEWRKITFLGIVLILICTASVFAASDIKLVVGGKIVTADVAPKVDNGRVMVPISTVSKALGAKVQWDSKSRTVVITPQTEGQTDVWSGKANIDKNVWVNVRNLITEYIIAYDSRDHEGKKLVTPDFDTDIIGPEVVIPTGGQTHTFIDYHFEDATILGDEHYKVRVAIVKQEQDTAKGYLQAVTKQNWDFDVVYNTNEGGYLIKGIWKAGEEILEDYSVVPGLTYKSEKVK